MYLIFDTETTGFPKNFNINFEDINNWDTARCVQLAWQLHDIQGNLINSSSKIIKPKGFEIPHASTKIHRITNEIADEQGHDIETVLDEFKTALENTEVIIGHNVSFDINVIGSEFFRIDSSFSYPKLEIIDTMKSTTDYCKITIGKVGTVENISESGKFKDFFKFRVIIDNGDSGLLYKKSDGLPNFSQGDKVSYEINNKGTIKVRKGYKSPKLEELYKFLFKEDIINAHNAAADVDATARCFFELLRQGFFNNENCNINPAHIEEFISKNKNQIKLLNISTIDTDHTNSKIVKIENQEINNTNNINRDKIINIKCHTSYSILQSTISIDKLIEHVKENNIKYCAITDKGNLFGAFEFVSKCIKNHIFPIVGCELYLVDNRHVRQGGFSRNVKDKRFSQILYAKNINGYKNLCKISSYGYIDGLYSGFPRVDKELILDYKEDLIVTTSGIYGEISYLFFNHGKNKAKECFLWWLENFQENFFIELSRNDFEDEEDLNNLLLSWGKEFGVRCIPSNHVYYLDEDDSTAQDALLCVKNGNLIDMPKGRGHGFRYGLHNNSFYFKSCEKLINDFQNFPNIFHDLEYFIDQFEKFDLSRDILLPKYELPKEFNTQIEYLKHLCLEGAHMKYDLINSELNDRILFELKTIENSGYPGYFLIVQDIIKKARSMGVSVGPGRGSVGGSVVAYCLDITSVDPMKYGLLFERFLNPERISMPDIDIDFDDVGRSKLISWVVEKYGANQVAQIITYGRMAAKSAIRDMGRVLNISLSEVDSIAKKIPNISLNEIFSLKQKDLSDKLNRDELNQINTLIESLKVNKSQSEMIDLARSIEGSIRNLGTHACGIIITPDDITNYVPVCVNGDSEMLITQFDNSVVEQAGMLKMDFLGLNTLSQIKDAVFLIKKRHKIEIDIDNIDLEDEKTFTLYQRGETLGTFQFESAGMQKHLRSLKPDKFEDLIAMNALYRPGPMEYIPNFIARKHGEEEILYDLPVMEKYLGNTYGITVYQEQVMKLSQELAGFSEGKADILRKAMGKKKKSILDGLKEEFFNGCDSKNYDMSIIKKIWRDWESFASYAFNKSHSTCYSFISFQTAYLKAHYPEEFMASLLTHHMNDLSKLSKYMEECKRISINVLGPDLNESYINYSVNQNNDIRFGLGAIKGVGSIAAEAIIEERKKNGDYKTFIDFLKRIDSKVVNKRVLEAMAYGGVFDNISNVNRANFFKVEDDLTFIENAIIYKSQISKKNEKRNQLTMFDSTTMDEITDEPVLSKTHSWSKLDLLNKEKEVLGLYASGHPLDDYRFEVKNICSHQIKDIDLFEKPVKSFTFSAYVKSHVERMSKNNQPYGILTLEDYSGTREFRLFGDNYIKFRNFYIEHTLLFFSASMITSKWSNENLRFQVNDVFFLSDVSKKNINEIMFLIPLEEINDKNIEKIVDIFSKYPGKHNLKINIFSDDVSIPFISKKFQVGVCTKFINEMSSISNNFVVK